MAVANGSTVTYSVAANAGAARSATITAAGQAFAITQSAAGCTYSLSASSASMGSEGGSGSFSVTAPLHCAWTVSSSAAWVTASANGSIVTYTVAANYGPARSATITAAGRTFTITQLELVCGYNLPIPSASIPAGGGTGSFLIEAPQGCSWSISADAPWLTITSGAAGAGTGTVQFSAGANSGAPRSVALTVAGLRFMILQTGKDTKPPFGSFDIPYNNTTGVVGTITVSGWALDDGEVTRISVWRDPLPAEPRHGNGLVYIDDAVFVYGARPDVERVFPNFVLNNRAGWGMQILTNMLPNKGNGTYRLHVIAEDAASNAARLGIHTITCANATATKPFGTIDTPAHGSTVSGNILNWGWALTPQPNVIPTDASTIWVVIDGQFFGHPSYNIYRQDVSTLFPNLENAGGPVGVYYIDTTTLSNGLHFICR